MRAVVVAIAAVVIAAGCMAEFPEPVGATPDASSGATGGVAGAAGSGALSGAGGSGLGGSAGVDGSLGGSAGVGGSAGTPPLGGSGGGGPDGGEPPGLVGYWPFDDNTSNVAKDLVGTRNGVFTAGAITWAADPTFGTVLSFDEGAGVTMSGWSGTAFPVKGTVSVWVKLDVVITETKNRGIFDNWSQTRDHVYMRRSNTDNGLPASTQGGCASATTGLIDSYNAKIPNKTWMHVAIGWDSAAGTAFYYVGGSLGVISLASEPGWTPKQQNFVFGDQFTGQLAEARLYDRPLTHGELTDIGKLQHD